MTNKKYLIIYILLIIVLVISLYFIFKPKKVTFGEVYKYLYDTLEYNLNIIENNMDDITISNKDFNWWKLKEIKSDDEKLINTYNLLVKDIRNCYLLSNDLENNKEENISILKFKNKEYLISQKRISLSNKKDCLKDFDKYNNLELSNDTKLSNKLKSQISIIIDYQSKDENYMTYEDLLYEETITINKMANLSNWLKIEYNTYAK